MLVNRSEQSAPERKRVRQHADTDHEQLVQLADSRRESAAIVAQQWRQVLALLAMPDSETHGLKKPDTVSWRGYIESIYSEELKDVPAWMDLLPALSFMDMLPRLSALFTKAEESAAKAGVLLCKAEERAERSRKHHERKDRRAKEKLELEIDDELRAQKEETAKMLGIFF